MEAALQRPHQADGVGSTYERLLREVVESLGDESGVALFERLTEVLGEALDADLAFIGRLEDTGPRIETLAVWRRDGRREQLGFALAGTPSERLIAEGVLVVESCAAARFPADADMAANGIEAYAGAPVIDREGQARGVLAVLSRRRFQDIDVAPRLLPVFARRVAVELERLQIERRLREANVALRRVRDEHAAAEARFRDFAEIGSDWYWETDSEHRFSFMSEGVSRVSGIEAAAYLGKTRREMLGPDTLRENLRALEALDDILAQRRPFRDFVMRYRRADGVLRWSRMSGRPILDAKGRFRGYRGAGADITALRRAEEEAALAAATLRDGVDAMTSGFALFDARQHLILCNDLFAQMAGKPDTAAMEPGIRFDDLLRSSLAQGALSGTMPAHEQEAFIARRMAEHCAADGRPVELQLRGGRWLESADRRTADGRIASVRTDITARKHAERRLLDAIENVPVGFIMCDPDDAFLLCNQRYRDLYPELGPRLRPGVSFAEICELCGDVVDADGAAMPFDDWLRERLARHRDPQGPIQTTTQTGRTVLVSESRTSEGCYVGAHVDISAIVLLQQQLERERQRAETALEARSRFLANMSHELRTPLNAIIGFADLIKMQTKGPLDAKYVEFAGLIKQSGRFLLSLIVDILDMSKIEAGQMPVDCAAVDPGPAVAEAAAMLSLQARDKGLTLGVEIAPDTPPVWAERRRLVQIVQNLVSNAVKFTAAGGVQVTGRQAGGMFEITVADSGAGMTAEEIAVALTPFQQVRNADSREYLNGTGLGLPLVKALVELHGGALRIDSEPGAGTSVRVTLPLAPGA